MTLKAVIEGPDRPDVCPLPADLPAVARDPVALLFCDRGAVAESVDADAPPRRMIVLAGDIGGTNARLALYAAGRSAGSVTLDSLFERTYPSTIHPSFDQIVEQFLRRGGDARPARPVASGAPASASPARSSTTSAAPPTCPGSSTEARWARASASSASSLVNDFQAAALGVTAVGPAHLAGLGGATPLAQGPIAVLGPGTGLGEAFLTWSPAREPLPGDRLRGGTRRSGAAHAARGGAAAVPDGEVRTGLLRAGAVGPRSGRRLHVPVAGAGVRVDDPGRHAHRAGDAGPRARPGGGDHPPRPRRVRPGVRDGAGDLLLGAGRRWPATWGCTRWPPAASSSPGGSRRGSCLTCSAAASARRSSTRGA